MSADLAVLRIHSEAIRLLVARLFHSRVTSGPLSLDKRTFPFLGSLLAGVLHPFRPRDYFWSISNRDEGVAEDLVPIEHLVAVRAQNNRGGNLVVLATAIKMSGFADSRYAKMRKERRADLSGKTHVFDR